MFIFPNKTVHRPPWNKGKLTGQKPPLLPKHVWAIRTKLHLDGRIRDLALFNLAIDSKLRGCDLVNLKAGDVAPHGYAIDRAMVRQRKTGRPVKFEIAEHTRQAVDNYLIANPRTSDDFLFVGWKGRNSSLTTRQYARLVYGSHASCNHRSIRECDLYGHHRLLHSPYSLRDILRNPPRLQSKGV